MTEALAEISACHQPSCLTLGITSLCLSFPLCHGDTNLSSPCFLPVWPVLILNSVEQGLLSHCIYVQCPAGP